METADYIYKPYSTIYYLQIQVRSFQRPISCQSMVERNDGIIARPSKGYYTKHRIMWLKCSQKNLHEIQENPDKQPPTVNPSQVGPLTTILTRPTKTSLTHLVGLPTQYSLCSDTGTTKLRERLFQASHSTIVIVTEYI